MLAKQSADQYGVLRNALLVRKRLDNVMRLQILPIAGHSAETPLSWWRLDDANLFLQTGTVG
jgi:hypothetical protein